MGCTGSNAAKYQCYLMFFLDVKAMSVDAGLEG